MTMRILTAHVSGSNGAEVGGYKQSIVVICLLLVVKLMANGPVILQSE